MRKARGWMVPATLLLWTMAACTVGPRYKRPSVGVPQQWPVVSASGQGASTTAPAIEEWWKSFHDAELESLVSRALMANLDLKLATDRVDEARANIGIARSGALPQITGESSATRFRQIGVGIVSRPTGPPLVERFPFEMNLFEPQATMSWEIDLFGRIRRGIQAAAADIRAQEEDRHNVIVILLGDVAANYVQVRGFQLRLEITQKNIAIEEDTLALTRDLSRAGQATERDVAQAEAQLESTRSTVPTLMINLDTAIHRLGVLLGMEPEALKPELEASAPLSPVPPQIPIGLPSELLKRRPDIRRAEAQLQAATARVGQAKADYFPTFSLTGSSGRVAPQLQMLTAGLNNVFSFGPSVTLPLFAGGRIRANVAVQNARLNEASAIYQSTVLTALEETENALVSYSYEQSRRDRLQKVVDADRTAFELSQTQYKAGLSDFLTVLDAERTLSENEDLLAQAQVTLVIDTITLYRALGGGWSNSIIP